MPTYLLKKPSLGVVCASAVTGTVAIAEAGLVLSVCAAASLLVYGGGKSVAGSLLGSLPC